MSYYPTDYPTERRGGCMEALSRCCRQAYVYPLDTRKLLYAGGALVGIVLIAVIWSGLSSSDSSSYVQPFKGSKVLHETPLIVGSNFFPVNLRNLVDNNITKVNFNQNLSNNTVFGNANCKSCQTDIPRLQSGLVGSQVWSLRVPCAAKYKDAVALTLEQVDAISRLLASYSNNVTIIRDSNDLMQDFKRYKMSGLLAVTSGHSFDGRMAVLRTLYNLGVRIMSITSDCSTAWASSFNDTDEKLQNDNGLSDFGRAVVKEMNRLGMVIDLSESSHKTQLDVLNVTSAPVIFTRAAAFNITNSKRNIKDDVLQKLKENGGLVMVTFASQYLSNNMSNVSISDVIKNINYIKTQIGIDKVGIGAEFDAENELYPAFLNDVSKFPVLFDKLGDEQWSESDLKKLAGENFLRVLQQVEKISEESVPLPADESYMLQINASCYSDYAARSSSSPTVKTTAPTTVSTPQTTTAGPSTTQSMTSGTTTSTTTTPTTTTTTTNFSTTTNKTKSA